jgi:uncharacterized protein DUF2752
MAQAEMVVTHEGHPHVVVPTSRFNQVMYRLWARSPRWSAPLLTLVCFAGGVAYTLADHPANATAFDSPTCLVKLTTGFDCPGCGGTRAFWYLMHGNLPAAARAHVMAVFAAPFLVYMYLSWTSGLLFRSKRLPMLRLSPLAISIFLIAWGVFSVLRNLPWAPFTWLYV